MCPQDNAADNDSESEYDEVILQVRNPYTSTTHTEWRCPRDNAADNNSDREYDEVIVSEQVRNPLDDPTPAQPTRNGGDEDSD